MISTVITLDKFLQFFISIFCPKKVSLIQTLSIRPTFEPPFGSHLHAINVGFIILPCRYIKAHYCWQASNGAYHLIHFLCESTLCTFDGCLATWKEGVKVDKLLTFLLKTYSLGSKKIKSSKLSLVLVCGQRPMALVLSRNQVGKKVGITIYTVIFQK